MPSSPSAQFSRRRRVRPSSHFYKSLTTAVLCACVQNSWAFGLDSVRTPSRNNLPARPVSSFFVLNGSPNSEEVRAKLTTHLETLRQRDRQAKVLSKEVSPEASFSSRKYESFLTSVIPLVFLWCNYLLRKGLENFVGG